MSSKPTNNGNFAISGSKCTQNWRINLQALSCACTQRSVFFEIRLGFLRIFSAFQRSMGFLRFENGLRGGTRSESHQRDLSFWRPSWHSFRLSHFFKYRWWFQGTMRVSEVIHGLNPVRDLNFWRSGWDSFGFFRLLPLLIVVSRCGKNLRGGSRSESHQRDPSFWWSC